MLAVFVVAYLTLIEIVKFFFDRREVRRPDAIARLARGAKLRAGVSNKAVAGAQRR
jgi:hypothetical protein